MGVYIKGMDEIPEDGAVLVVMHDNGKTYIKHACTYGYSMEMVEVPEPHGRLIDADKLIIDLMDRGLEGIQTDDYSEIQQTIIVQDTVIETEGE